MLSSLCAVLLINYVWIVQDKGRVAGCILAREFPTTNTNSIEEMFNYLVSKQPASYILKQSCSKIFWELARNCLWWNSFLKNFKGAFSGLRQFLAIGSPLIMMENAFYFTPKALFNLKIFKFLSWHLSHVTKQLD